MGYINLIVGDILRSVTNPSQHHESTCASPDKLRSCLADYLFTVRTSVSPTLNSIILVASEPPLPIELSSELSSFCLLPLRSTLPPAFGLSKRYFSRMADEKKKLFEMGPMEQILILMGVMIFGRLLLLLMANDKE